MTEAKPVRKPVIAPVPAPLAPDFSAERLQARLDCLVEVLTRIASQVDAVTDTVANLGESEQQLHVVSYALESIGWMIDRCTVLAGAEKEQIASADQWHFGPDLARAMSVAEGMRHG